LSAKQASPSVAKSVWATKPARRLTTEELAAKIRPPLPEASGPYTARHAAYDRHYLNLQLEMRRTFQTLDLAA